LTLVHRIHSIKQMFAHLSPFLADADDYIGAILWSAAILLLMIGAFFGYSRFKQWMAQPEEPAPGGFTLSDLRALLQTGKLTQAEFDVARQKIVDSAKRAAQQLPDPLARAPRKSDPSLSGPADAEIK
jgi:hypothetical protein